MRIRALPLLFAFSLLVVVETTTAQASGQLEDHAASRTIGDTRFMLPALADSAFVVSEFGFWQGINYQSVPNYPVSTFARYNLSWVEFQERVDLAVRITPWLGLYGQGIAAGALGVDAPSLLFEGGGLDFSGKGGIVLRVLRSETTRSQLAIRAYGGGDAGRTLDLPDFLEGFASDAARDAINIAKTTTNLDQLPGELKNAALTLANTNYSALIFYRSSAVTTGGSLHYAQGIVGPLTVELSAELARTWGQQKPFNPGSQQFVSVPTTDTTFTFDGVLSVDFNRWRVPFGLSAEYAGVAEERSLTGSSFYLPSTQYAGGGVWFTGRRGLEIGALAFTQHELKAVSGFGTQQVSGKPSGLVGALVFRALW
jgi:hypothetical protein